MRAVGVVVLALGVCVMATGTDAQLNPGHVLVTDGEGTLWQISPAGLRTTLAQLGTQALGVDVDPSGAVLVGGIGVIWRVADTGSVTTVAAGGLVRGWIHEIEITRRRTFYFTSLMDAAVTEMDHAGVVVDRWRLPGGVRAWGLGVDPVTGMVYAAGLGSIYALKPTGAVEAVFRGPPIFFFQSGDVGPSGLFAVGEEFGRQLLHVDRHGRVVTIHAGPPFRDPAEGIDHLSTGEYVITDDSAPPAGDAVLVVTPTRPAVVTTLVAGPPFDDLNGLAVVPELVLTQRGPASVGKPVTFAVRSTGAALEPYLFATSLSMSQGISLPGGRRFPLDLDALLFATASNLLPDVFQRYQGRLDVAGRTSLAVLIPADPALVGVKFYTAGVTLHPGAPGHIHVLSAAVVTPIGW